MLFTFCYRHMDRSDALEAYTERKFLHSIQKLTSDMESVAVIFSALSKNQMTCSAELNGRSLHMHVKDDGSYMYDCVDRMAHKIESLLRKRKEKKKPKAETHAERATRFEEQEAQADGLELTRKLV